jgi:nucleoside-diphosphate-sugar epimerase
MPSIFCFGLGYTAERLALALQAQGWAVGGTCRSQASQARLAKQGFAIQRFAGDLPAPAEPPWSGASHLLLSIAPDEAGDPVLAAYAAALGQSQFEWVGYLSTTGVYGDRGGGVVDETSELRPTSARAQRRIEAERGWLELWRRSGLPVHVFRLAGIYGPRRSAIDSLKAQTAQRIDKPGHVFSRIHVDDIAQVLAASIRRPRPGAIYNVCDDCPAEPRRVIEHAAGLLGVKPPPLQPFASAKLSEMARSFYRDNKRVGNDLIKRELGVTLRYPDFKAGLGAILTGV